MCPDDCVRVCLHHDDELVHAFRCPDDCVRVCVYHHDDECMHAFRCPDDCVRVSVVPEQRLGVAGPGGLLPRLHLVSLQGGQGLLKLCLLGHSITEDVYSVTQLKYFLQTGQEVKVRLS